MRVLTKCLMATSLACLVSALWAQDDAATPEGLIGLDANTLVVFPTEVLSIDAKAADLAGQASEELSRRLSSIGSVVIIGPESLVAYADSELRPEQIAQQLGAAHFLESAIWVNTGTTYLLRMSFKNAIDGETRLGTSGTVGFVNSGPTHLNLPPVRGAAPESVPVDMLLPRSISRAVQEIANLMFPEPRKDRELVLAETRAVVLNTSLSDNERLRALESLRPPTFGGQIDVAITTEQLGGAVAIAAAELAANSVDASVRSRIWNVLTGVQDEYLIEPLIHAASTDVSAVRALAYFRGEARVTEALNNILNTASEEPLRRAAHLALITDAELHEELRATALDTNKSIQERLVAVGEISTRHSHTLPLDREFTLGMVDFAHSLRRPQARSQIWYMLGKGGNMHFVQPALAALENDPDESVRDLIVHSLDEYLDHPSVLDALEVARLDDASPLVRKSAQEILQEVADNDSEIGVR